MTSHRAAPYTHLATGTPCWTKHCSIPNNAAPEGFDDLARVSIPPTEQELATFGAWLDDPTNPVKRGATKDIMFDSISKIEPTLPGQTWVSIDKEKLHAVFEDAYQERLHILEYEEQDAYLYHAMDADALMVEVLSRYDDAADDGDVDAMRDVLFLNHMDDAFKSGAQAWLEHRVAQDYPYNAQQFGVSIGRQSYEAAYQAGITTALAGWTQRTATKNPHDAAANGVFPQANGETRYGHEDFYNKGLIVGLQARAQRR